MSPVIAGIAASVAFLVGVPTLGVLTVIAFDEVKQRRSRNELCCCIHTRAAHEHYRPGEDCAHCDCPGFLSAVRVARTRTTPVGPTALRSVS